MTSPYRNDADALRERKVTLEREIAQLKEHTSRLEGLRSREQELERELAAVAEKLGASPARRGLPMLDQVKVASPCSASWDEMLGDDRVRFCVSCEKNVYNLSAMPADDAERLLAERSKGELCVRYYRRADGTIMTADCPVGVKRKRRKQVALAVAGAGAMALAAGTALYRGTTCAGMAQGKMVQGGAVMGDVAEPPPPPPPVMGSAAPLPPK